MDGKLKALKVVDLRQILTTAKVSFPARATKSDLIEKIQSNKSALDAYAGLYPPDDLLAPPEEVDWNTEQPEVVADSPPAAVPTPSAKPTAAPVEAPVVATTTTETSTATATEDSELEKRRRRSERFGIPLLEAKQKNVKQPPQKSASGVTSELEARAKRFGTNPDEPKPNGKKRSAQTEDIDPEELARRKKRSERFGLPVKT